MTDCNVLIGITGGSASGKSRLSRELYQALGDASVLITQDDYYFDSSTLSEQERADKNYDHPDAVDLYRLQEDLQALKRGESINAPIYCFETHARLKDTKPISSAQVIIVEGIFVLHQANIKDLLDIKVFLSVESDTRLLRRIVRDVGARGRTIESVAAQYLETVRPMHQKFIEPALKHADIVFSSEDNEDVDKAVIKLTEMISGHLARMSQ